MVGKFEVTVVDLPLIRQLDFQQSILFTILKVPQIQFIDRMVVIPVATQRMGTHSANCAEDRRDSTGAVPWFGGPRSCEHAATSSSSSLSTWANCTESRRGFTGAVRLRMSLRSCSDLREVLRFCHRQGHDGLRWTFRREFTAFFALRPDGRRVPGWWGVFGSPRWPTIVGGRGLGVTGTPGVRLPGVLSLVNSSQ